MSTAFDSESSSFPPPRPVSVLVTAAPLELEPLSSILDDPVRVAIAGKPGLRGRARGVEVLALAGGMGKTNAAHALTVVLERARVLGVVGFGVGGGYVGGGAGLGTVAVASSETYGDEGVETPDGWISTEGIGIPLLERSGIRRFNEFPLEERLVGAAARRLHAHGIPNVTGPFVTVSCCSGTLRRGEELRSRLDAVCESMEGAAHAQVCALYDTPFLEVRGVSNLVEDRDLSRWRLPEAAALAARAAVLVADLFDPALPGRAPASRHTSTEGA